MLTCRLGCDELYERGFIAVDATGHLYQRAPVLAYDLPDYVAKRQLIGRKCAA